MKPSLPVLIVLALGITPVAAQVSPVTARKVSEPAVTGRGPHHRVWTRTIEETSPTGQKTTRLSSYTELATGLHYHQDGQWVEAKEEVEILADGAAAQQGQHQAFFAANLNTRGAITLVLPDGQRMTTHVLGLAYVDHATGKSAMIAEVKDCVGEVHRPNRVIYRDAFDGDFRASVRFTYTRAGLAQDILLETQPPPPEDYGLAAETTSLEVWTEVVNSPEPTKLSRLVPVEETGTSLPDEHLDFGSMRMGSGRAFSMGQEDLGGSIPVRKTWQKTTEGRQFLLESVPVPQAKPQLDALPQAAQPNRERQQRIRRLAEAAPTPRQNAAIVRLFPPAPKARPIEKQPMQMASVAAPAKAFVLDYEISGTLNNFTFCSDTNYYVTGPVTLSGTATFEGGTVIKFASGVNAQLSVDSGGTLVCLTTNYRPAVLTAKDDDTVGESIAGSTGNPWTNYYASCALNLGYVNGKTFDLHHLRIAHAQNALDLAYAPNNDCQVRHAQIVHCQNAISGYAANVTLRNVLVHQLGNYVLNSPAATLKGEHLTIDGAYGLFTGYPASCAVLTNTLLANVTSPGTYSGANNAEVAGNAFQTVGAAAHYLAEGSVHRNAGAANINAALSEELKQLTTDPPVVYSPADCYFSQSLDLFPQAVRDTDTPDLGYHYAPLDYAFGHTYLTNATIQVQPGTAIGTFGTTAYPYGLAIFQGAKLLGEGTPIQPIQIAGFETVQEMMPSDWKAVDSVRTPWALTTPRPELSFRFVEWSHLAGGRAHLNSGNYFADTPPVVIRDCAFHSGWFGPNNSFSAPLAVTNCLFERVGIALSSLAPPVVFQNNLFHGGYFMVDYITEPAQAEFYDNLFDQTLLEVWSDCLNSHNGYVSNYVRLAPESTNDVILASVTYQAGPLGPFYYPTNSPLINAGSTNASLLSLYHHTTTTNQVKETTSIVDIGYHYVAVTNVAGVWLPIDSDGDGLSDLQESFWGTNPNDADTDDDGLTDGDEVFVHHTNPTVADTDGDGMADQPFDVKITKPRVGVPQP